MRLSDLRGTMLVWLCLTLGCSLCLAASAAGKLTVHFIPHTHADVGWLKTVDQYYTGGKPFSKGFGVRLKGRKKKVNRAYSCRCLFWTYVRMLPESQSRGYSRYSHAVCEYPLICVNIL